MDIEGGYSLLLQESGWGGGEDLCRAVKSVPKEPVAIPEGSR